MAELAGALVGNYFLLECLSHEGMVETYQARPTTRGGFDVVLRLFRPPFPDPTAFREHFATEVEKLWRCRHEHIQPLLEFGAGEDLLYSATVFPEAETLEQFLARQPQHFLPLDSVVRVTTQLCAALQYAHTQDIVHGNIQPSSILVRDGAHLLLTNFGLRRAYQENEPGVSHINEGNAAYTAPEQVLGMLSPASDIYALGVLLYRLLTGVLPYDGKDASEIALKHASEPIPSLRKHPTLQPEIPEAVELVVRVALSKNPEARFSSVATLAQALLAALIADNPPEPVPVTIPAPRRIEVKSRRTAFTWSRAVSLLTLSTLLVGLLGASAFIFFVPTSLWSGSHSGSSGPSPGTSSISTQAQQTAMPLLPTRTVPPSVGSTTSPPGSKAGEQTPPAQHQSPTVVPSRTTTPSSTATPSPNPTPTALPPTPQPPLLACASGTLALDGPPSLQSVLQQVNNDYQALCSGLTISARSDGNRVALNLVQQGQIDVAACDLTARPSRNLTDHPVVALLYALIANPGVQVSGLSSTEIQDMYQGNITNWAQVGGANQTITVLLPPASDAATAIFQNFVLGGTAEHVHAIKLNRNWENLIPQVVAQVPGSISYVPLWTVQQNNVQVLSIDGIAPSSQALQQGTYAFWSVEHLYTQGSGTPQFQAYMQFFTTAQEGALLDQFGVVPLSALQQQVLASHLPGPML